VTANTLSCFACNLAKERQGRGTHIAKIALLGSFMAASFVAAADGHGGTLFTDAAQTANQLGPLTTPHAG
jgi:hypothetical protein